MKRLSKFFLAVVLLFSLSSVAMAGDPRNEWGLNLFKEAEVVISTVNALLRECKRSPFEEIVRDTGLCSTENLKKVLLSLKTFDEACPTCIWDEESWLGIDFSSLEDSIHETITDLSRKRTILTGEYSAPMSEEKYRSWWNYKKSYQKRRLRNSFPRVYRNIMQHWAKSENLQPGLEVVIYANINPNTGLVLRVEVFDSSGNEAFDNSVLKAVERSSPFPITWSNDNAVSFGLDFSKWFIVIGSDD